MRALVWHGKQDIRCDSVPDPRIEQPRDAIIKVTSCAICGSDLHLYDGFMPGMENGDVMGHETMGEVVEVGPDCNKLKVGDRVVIPFTIICGECEQCRRGNFSVCERSNRNKDMADKVFGHTTAGLFGYTHLTGGYAGGQAEYLRVPFADTTHIKVPEQPVRRAGAVPVRHLPDRLAGRGAVRHPAHRHRGDLGLRPGRADGDPQRRPARREAGRSPSTTCPSACPWPRPAARPRSNFDEESVVERLNELTDGKGPEKCIDAVGMEAHATATLDTMYDRAKQAVMLETDRPHVLREMIYVCRPAGMLSVPGVYGGLLDKIPFGHGDEQGPDHPHRPDPREPLDRRPAAADRGGPDRSLLRHHPHASGWNRGRRCTRPSATSRTAASRSCSSHERAAHVLSERAVQRRDERRADTTLGLAQGLGWFSIGLGLAELLAPHAAGPQPRPARPGEAGRRLWRAGDRDRASASSPRATRRPGSGAGSPATRWTSAPWPAGWRWGAGGNAAMPGWRSRPSPASPLLDVLCGRALARGRPPSAKRLARDYGDRRGMPQPAEAMRGAARDFEVPRDFRIPDPLRPWTSAA